MPVLTLAQSEELAVRTLLRCRTSQANAQSVARALVAAEADGLKGHGLSRLPGYAAQAKAGKVDGFAVPAMTKPKPSVIAIDAAHGFAYPALDLALSELPSVTRANGVAVGAIRRSHHCGAAGHPVERLAEAGLVAMMFANTPSAIAPWGGSKAVFGTNPVAFACPYPGHAPIVVDLSLSKVARGNIMAAKQRGETIPEGWALDEDGKPTTDPQAALRGTMLPLGDAKGTALALMVELLAAGLTGSNFAAEASSFLDAKGSPPGTGQLIVAFDAAAIGGPDVLGRFAVLASSIEDQPGARLPGSRRLAAAGQGAGAGAHDSGRAAGRDRGGLMPAKRARPADMRIRKGRLSDMDALMALEHGVFTVDHLSRKSFRNFLTSPHSVLMVAEEGDTLAGYVHVLFRPRSKAARLYSIGAGADRPAAASASLCCRPASR